MTMLAFGAPTCTSRPALLKAVRSSSSVKAHERLFLAANRPHRSPRIGHARPGVAYAAAQQQQTTTTESEDRVPPGCARYSIQLGKPLGLVLEEDKNGNIFVAEVVEGGNAAKSGEVTVGDQLIATSGLVYTTQQKYQDNWVRGGEQIVRLNVRGEKFDTVMAAISSHPASIKVTLEFQRCS